MDAFERCLDIDVTVMRGCPDLAPCQFVRELLISRGCERSQDVAYIPRFRATLPGLQRSSKDLRCVLYRAECDYSSIL